jgi:hypothetical protein
VQPVRRRAPPGPAELFRLCLAAGLLPPWGTGLAALGLPLPVSLGVIGTLVLLSLPTYLAYYAAGRALMERQASEDDVRQTLLSLKWDLAGGAVLLNVSFLEYFTLGERMFAEPVQLAVIALTDMVVFLIGAGLVDFVRGQILRRRT